MRGQGVVWSTHKAKCGCGFTEVLEGNVYNDPFNLAKRQGWKKMKNRGWVCRACQYLMSLPKEPVE